MDEPSSPLERLERTAGPVYFLAALFLVLPLIDYVMNVWPLNPGLVNWRYGALGLSGGFLLTPLLGLVMLLAGSVFFGHRVVRLTTGVLCAVLAIGLVLGTMLFVLDALQMRRAVPQGSRWLFDAGVVKAVLKMLTGAACSGWIALVAFRRVQDAPARSRRAPGAPLVVGTAEGAASAKQ